MKSVLSKLLLSTLVIALSIGFNATAFATNSGGVKVSNKKMLEIKENYKALNWDIIAQEAGLDARIMQQIMNNQTLCIETFAVKLAPVLQKYGAQVESKELVGEFIAQN